MEVSGVVEERRFGTAPVMVRFEASEVASGGCLAVFAAIGAKHAGEVAGDERFDGGD